MPRINHIVKPKCTARMLLVVGCQRAQSECNRNENFASAPKSIYPALALAMGRYAQLKKG